MDMGEGGTQESMLRFRAGKDVAVGRAARVSISASGGGQTQAAPKIALLVD